MSNNTSRLRSVSVCLTDLLDNAKQGHSAFSRSEKNGKVYINLSIWDKDEPDQYENNVSVQLNPRQEFKERDKALYVGNGKIREFTPRETVNSPDAPLYAEENTDDLPF